MRRNKSAYPLLNDYNEGLDSAALTPIRKGSQYYCNHPNTIPKKELTITKDDQTI